MQRAGIPLFVAFFSALLLPLLASAESELWTCNRVDGSIMFTNKSQDLTGCSQYRLRTELGFFKGTVEAKKEVPKPTAAPQEPTAPSSTLPITINIIISTPPPMPPAIEMLAPVGEIPFETYRMLSVGMTEAEVLGRAGLPQTTYIGTAYPFNSPYPFWPIFGANRFVYSSGDWIVELTFSGGRVLSINQTRLRP